jgi:anaerobic magnesium-protoporphyrin IX monomethyl ester cyclase
LGFTSDKGYKVKLAGIGKHKNLKVLLVEANDMPKWVGNGIMHEVHIPPIGLMYLAAYARTIDPSLELRIVESSLHCRTDEEFLKIVTEFKPDIVGIRSITFFLDELRRVVRLSRAYGDPFVVVGGPIVQAYKQSLFSYSPEIDMAVKGEGESVFSEILAGQNPQTIRGILYREGAEVIENPNAPPISDCNHIPFPAYDLIDLDLYQKQLSYAYNHRRQGVLVTSRGCTFDCTFCFKHTTGIRLRSAENVYEEITMLHQKFGINDLYIVDDIFNVNVKRALSIFHMIIRDGLKIRIYFSNGLRADIVPREFVDSAIQAGAIWFTYAVESANPDIQNLVNKHIHLDKARDIIEYTQSKGVVVNISTMYGFPTEEREMALQTLDWLGTLKNPSLLPYHFNLRCFPGSRICEQALAAGWDPKLMELSGQLSYNDLPLGTPTLSKSDMYQIILQYHERFGLNNMAALSHAIATLKSVGYAEEEILHMYSVLKNKAIHSIQEISPSRSVSQNCDESLSLIR